MFGLVWPPVRSLFVRYVQPRVGFACFTVEHWRMARNVPAMPPRERCCMKVTKAGVLLGRAHWHLNVVTVHYLFVTPTSVGAYKTPDFVVSGIHKR